MVMQGRTLGQNVDDPQLLDLHSLREWIQAVVHVDQADDRPFGRPGAFGIDRVFISDRMERRAFC